MCLEITTTIYPLQLEGYIFGKEISHIGMNKLFSKYSNQLKRKLKEKSEV